MSRKPREALPKKPNPLDEFSTWDVRIAKVFYYGIILASAITVIGIWGTILGFIPVEKWELFLSLALGYQIAIIAGAITAHLFLLVVFYTLFRGGIVKMCRRLFKDRLVAKKWEDYYGLRLLLAVALLAAYVTIISLLISLLPTVFYESLVILWTWQLEHFTIGAWILWFGAIMFVIIGLIFLGFVIWNHGVYLVLKKVKRIKEETEIEEEIKKEKLKKAGEKALKKEYKKETGEDALYLGKETPGYLEWKKKNELK